MKALLLVSMVAALAAWTSPAFAGPVTIQPGAYSGRYFINGVGGPYFGNQTIDLSAGTYFIDLGAEIAGSGFTVDIDASGTSGRVWQHNHLEDHVDHDRRRRLHRPILSVDFRHRCRVSR